VINSPTDIDAYNVFVRINTSREVRPSPESKDPSAPLDVSEAR